MPFTLTLHIHLTILISARWSATSFSFLTGQLWLPRSILLRTHLLYSVPLLTNDMVTNQWWLVTRVTGQLADTPPRGLDISRTGQLADWTTRRCHQRLCVLIFSFFWRHLRDRELSSPRVDQSASWRIRELSSYHDQILCAGSRHVPHRVRVRLARKRNEDEDSPNKLYTLVTHVAVTTFKGKPHLVVVTFCQQ